MAYRDITLPALIQSQRGEVVDVCTSEVHEWGFLFDTMTNRSLKGIHSFIAYQEEAIPSLLHDQGSNLKKKKRKRVIAVCLLK